MKKEYKQAILKIIRMIDMLLDASRCKDLRDDGLTGREHLLPQKGYSFQSPHRHSPQGYSAYVSSLVTTGRAYIVILLRKKLAVGHELEKGRNPEQPKKEMPAATERSEPGTHP